MQTKNGKSIFDVSFPMKMKSNNPSKWITKVGYTELQEIYDKIGKDRDPLKLWDLSKPLPPITLAVWYMDDGHKYNNVTVLTFVNNDYEKELIKK